MAEKFIGFGTVLKFSTDNSTTFSHTLANVVNISRSGGGSNVVDATVIDDATRYESKLGGTVNPGQVTVSTIYDPTDTTHKNIVSLYSRQFTTKWQFSMLNSSSTKQEFSGFVQNISGEIPLRDRVTKDITIEVSGHPGWSS